MASSKGKARKVEAVSNMKHLIGPQILKPLSSAHLKLGDNTQLQCIFVGHPTPAFKWFYNGEEIDSEVPGLSLNCAPISQPAIGDERAQNLEAIQACLDVTNCTINHAGVYKFTAFNECGSASTSANVVVLKEDFASGFYY